MPRSHAARSAWRNQRVLVVASSILLALLGLVLLALRAGGGGINSTVPVGAVTSTVDPHLILHPHTLAIAATVTHGVQLRGTLAPDMPGTNTLAVTLQGSALRRVGDAPLRLEATMPGMGMSPVHAALIKKAGHYGGALRLPMFGTYRLAVEAPTTAGIGTGIITVTIPLPGL